MKFPYFTFPYITFPNTLSLTAPIIFQYIALLCIWLSLHDIFLHHITFLCNFCTFLSSHWLLPQLPLIKEAGSRMWSTLDQHSTLALMMNMIGPDDYWMWVTLCDQCDHIDQPWINIQHWPRWWSGWTGWSKENITMIKTDVIKIHHWLMRIKTTEDEDDTFVKDVVFWSEIVLFG